MEGQALHLTFSEIIDRFMQQTGLQNHHSQHSAL